MIILSALTSNVHLSKKKRLQKKNPLFRDLREIVKSPNEKISLSVHVLSMGIVRDGVIIILWLKAVFWSKGYVGHGHLIEHVGWRAKEFGFEGK